MDRPLNVGGWKYGFINRAQAEEEGSTAGIDQFNFNHGILAIRNCTKIR